MIIGSTISRYKIVEKSGAGGNLRAFKNPNGTSQGRWSAGYDGENKQRCYCAAVFTPCTALIHDVEYVYDGEGKRSQKADFGRGVHGLRLRRLRAVGDAEYSTAGPSGTAGSYFRTTDHLGSTRLVTNSSGNVYDRRDFFPFGEQIATSYSNRTSPGNYNGLNPASTHLFTAKERDDESGLDYFGARYFGSSLGRFTSADAPFADQHASAPQSWNLYGYVRNNPLKFVDDDGRELRIAIFNSSSQSQQTAARAGQRIATLYRDAGVKNVTVEVTNAAPGSLDRVGALAASVKGGLGFGQHSATLEFRDSAESTGGIMTGQSIPAGNAGHFRDGQAMVNVNAVPVANTDPNFVGPPDPAVALSNTGAHEVAHNALQGHATGEKDPTNIMFPKATAPVINRPDLRFNESQAEVLRKRFNREDEVEGQ